MCDVMDEQNLIQECPVCSYESTSTLFDIIALDDNIPSILFLLLCFPINDMHSRDCPIFYMRKKVQQDLEDQDKLVERFGLAADWQNNWPAVTL